MPLTDVKIRSARPKEKTYRLFDGGGLYLEVAPRGGRWWRLKYRYEGKEKRISLGVYPDISLKDARDRRDDARKLLANGVDPSQARRAGGDAAGETFEAVAREWHLKHSPNWTEGHADTIIRRLEANIFPYLGKQPIRAITPPELLAVLRRIEARGALETAHRVHQVCGQIFRYAVATGRAERDPSGDLRGALPPVKEKHHPAIIDPKQIAALLRSIDGYTGSHIVRSALFLAPLVFVRPGELRHAEWSEIDLEGAEWRIPAVKMKMRTLHIVPLSLQAIAILQDLYPLTGSGSYVFPSLRSSARPMSENTVNAALRRLGYDKDEMTGHGFRSIASTILNEQGWNKDAIERQLAHAERDNVRAAYNYADYLPERRRMMQAWADYLDTLKNGKLKQLQPESTSSFEI